MPRPLRNPERRERERSVAAEIYAKIFGEDAKVRLHRTQACFFLKVEGNVFKVEVKEQDTVAERF